MDQAPTQRDRLTTSDPGRYWVTTFSGTRHLVDLDEWTITRYPVPGHEFTQSYITPDGTPFRFVTFNYCAVGEKLYVTALSGEWRQTSTIQSIEVATDIAKEPPESPRPSKET